ncbi:MAG: transcriptional repressor LexA [Cypionkella sp.]|nr:transcriptional repressor LexA [Cypionkella sp.]
MLTRKQLELLNSIQMRTPSAMAFRRSFDEMNAMHLDLRSKSGIHRLITALEERGFIRRLAHRARAIEIVKLPESLERKLIGKKGDAAPAFAPRVIDGDKPAPVRQPRGAMPVEGVFAMELPVMGRIAAGVPIEAIQQISHHVAVPGSMLAGSGEHYALEVKGDSMIEAGINDGDIVVIREQIDAQNGDIVVALVEDHEATLKRFRRRGNMIALEAANPAYETRVFPDHLVKVQGKLVGLIRSY